MVRIWIIIGAMFALLLPACQKQNEEPQATAQEPMPLEQMDSDYGYSTTTDDSYAAGGTQTGGAEMGRGNTTGEEVLAPTGGRVHTVQRGDTLYKLARQYYGEQRRWKDIYEANRSRLPDPNQLRVGSKLVIP